MGDVTPYASFMLKGKGGGSERDNNRSSMNIMWFVVSVFRGFIVDVTRTKYKVKSLIYYSIDIIFYDQVTG